MDIDTFILIGGRSTRMGRAKATLELAGHTLTERTSATVHRAFPTSRITLVAAAPAQADETLPVIFDKYKNRGPIGAIHAALASAHTEWALVLACDFPFISTELLTRFADELSGNCDAVAPIQPDGNVQPLCAFYRVKSCLHVIKKPFGEKRPPPAKWLLEQLRTIYVPFDEIAELPNSANFFLNVNTPADLARANALLTTPE